MKLVFYHNVDQTILDVIENVENPEITAEEIKWDNGSVTGINVPFLVLEDSVDLSNGLTSEIILLDKKSKFPDKESKREKRIQSIEMAILTLMNRA